jgi:hypothetical protein
MAGLADVREGMGVVDGTGHHVGTVRAVQMGDPEAVTAEGQTVGQHHGLIGAVDDSLTDSGVDGNSEMRERQLRLGYVAVDANGIGGDFTVAGDAVDAVVDDIVHLNTQRPAS